MVALPETVTLWTYRRIPHEFEPGYPFQRDVRKAMDKWEMAAGVSFVSRVNERNYLVIRNPKSKRSRNAVGMRGGSQAVDIEIGYKSLHELGHGLGLIHEQCRSDRDQFIEVQWSNMAMGEADNEFQIVNNSQNLTEYDPVSVMHYPAPAKGWQGIPHHDTVRTMRRRLDSNKKLGPQNWTELSELDKNPQGLRARYLTVPVPMGREIARGSWNYAYAVHFPFSIGGRQFFYGQNLSGKNRFIQELLLGGTIGAQTANGSWGFAYAVQFPFTIGGRVFFYGQNLVEKNWFIQELLPGGRMGTQTDHGHWNNAYQVQLPYSIGHNQYFLGYNQCTGY
jgi:hypothetical protein